MSWKYSVVSVWRAMAGAFVDACGHFVEHYDYWNPHRAAMLQAGVSGLFPFWQGGSVRRQYPFGDCQHLLDDFQRNPVGDCSPLKRPAAVLYHYRHPVWDAVLQNGEAGTVSLWSRCDSYIRKEDADGTNFSGR